MKRRLFSKLIAMLTATVFVLGTNNLTAFATEIDNGVEAGVPKGEEKDGVRSSSGKATVEEITTQNGEKSWQVKDDDDSDDPGNDPTADISVWAKIVTNGHIVYKVDISWGAMKFEFNNQTAQWNTDTHTYDESDTATAAWTAEGFIDGTNNKIEVVNHSNAAVDTQFSYSHEGAPFNNVEESANAVRGHFFLDNTDAVDASEILENSGDDIDNELSAPLMLGHQDSSNAVNYGGDKEVNTEGSHTRSVYFTFNGTPDPEKMEALKNDFTKVGVITVTIEPTSGS